MHHKRKLYNEAQNAPLPYNIQRPHKQRTVARRRLFVSRNYTLCCAKTAATHGAVVPAGTFGFRFGCFVAGRRVLSISDHFQLATFLWIGYICLGNPSDVAVAEFWRGFIVSDQSDELCVDLE